MPPSAEVPLSMPIGISTGYGADKHHGTKFALDMKPTSNSGVDIIDIRRVALESNLKAEILSRFHAKEGPRTLPTLLLYDEKGLQLFEQVSVAYPSHTMYTLPLSISFQITYLEEYYLTNDEIAVLTSSAAEIAKLIPSGSMVIELGSGCVLPS